MRNELPWENVPNNFNPERVESNQRLTHPDVMPQSLSKILVHAVFSTKDRRPLLRNNPLREELYRYHRKVLFQDEFRQFLKRYEIEFDARYVWD